MAEATVVCDLDGVLYLGNEPIPGSGEALDRLVTAGVKVLFCTNNSSRTRIDTAEKIERVTGHRPTIDQVFTSAMAAARLARGSAGALVVGGPGVVEALAEIDVPVVSDREHCDVVMVGLDTELSYDKLTEATLAVRAGARLIATNHDATFPSPDGLKPGGGAIVAALEVATGTRAVVAGKPNQPMRDLLLSHVVTSEVWMVGDRVDTDLAMARAAGWRSALVRTGVPRSAGDGIPDMYSEDLAEFVDALLHLR